MTTPETKVKKKVNDIYKRLGIYYDNRTGGYGTSNGRPDGIGCINGIFFGNEIKADRTKKLTDLQILNMNEIRKSGGITLVTHANNIDELEDVLQLIINLSAQFIPLFVQKQVHASSNPCVYLNEKLSCEC